jgi:hypothetical protein
MKLSAATAAAVLICLGSLVAKASINHHREVVAAEAAARAAALETPTERSEKIALAGLDTRLKSRLHRMAAK